MTASSAVLSTLPPPPTPTAPPPVTPGSGRPSWVGAAKLAAPLGAALGLALWQPSDDGVSICPWRNCTGGACPGCGLTRGAASFFRGDLANSWYYHPAAGFIVVQVAAIWAVVVGRRIGVITWDPPASLTKLFIVFNGVLLVSLWLLRWRLGHLERVL
ncbi:MAG: DUF2752 domain-containing protein [Acidimicrobiales bacterium]